MGQERGGRQEKRGEERNKVVRALDTGVQENKQSLSKKRTIIIMIIIIMVIIKVIIIVIIIITYNI